MNGRLARFASLIREWAPKLDLVSPGDLEHLEERHIQDSLRLLPLLAECPEGPCADVGAGAGFPGIPLAISSNRHWRLLEPRKRRAGFLELVVRELGLDCEVVPLRAEEASTDPLYRHEHALVTARALARPGAALELIRPLVAPQGRAAIFLGESAETPPGTSEDIPGVAIFKVNAI